MPARLLTQNASCRRKFRVRGRSDADLSRSWMAMNARAMAMIAARTHDLRPAAPALVPVNPA